MSNMHIRQRVAKKSIVYIFIAVFIALWPMATTLRAQEVTDTTTTTPTTETTTPVPETTQPAATTTTDPATTTVEPNVIGPTQPTGVERESYTLNPETGMYENGVYAWDPVTKQTKPLNTPTYSFNPETNRWDTVEYRYDAPTGKYVPNVVSVEQPPSGAVLSNSSEESQPSSLSSLSSDSDSTNNETSNTGPDSTNKIKDESSSNGFFDLFHNATISNTIDSLAKTGNALISGNTLAGDATTGTAIAMANVINMLNTSWNPLGGSLFTFVTNVLGDVVGDLLINPMDYKDSGSGSSSALPDNLKVNVEESATITNDINLNAQSGDANVEKNTTAGNATTGDAYAIANILNAINSVIAANDSFVGVINIFGNLDGDILLPPEVLNSLLASNLAQTVDTSQFEDTSLIANFTNDQNIDNNVSASAQSGNATVAHNTTAGDATTGDATTNITLLNLTGRQVVASNSLLVFVNVLGEWVGLIMDAPQGSTAAALGGNTSSNLLLPENTEINQESNTQITNNLNLNAQTGDATVASNTTAGNATTGDALSAANIANLTNSQFSLSNWFGVLFINVFGSWNGSFNVNTAAGNIPGSGGGLGAQKESTSSSDVKVFQFVPSDNGKLNITPSNVFGTYADCDYCEGQNEIKDNDAAAVAGSTSSTPPASSEEPSVTSPNFTMQLIGGMIAFALLGAERAIKYREQHGRILPKIASF